MMGARGRTGGTYRGQPVTGPRHPLGRIFRRLHIFCCGLCGLCGLALLVLVLVPCGVVGPVSTLASVHLRVSVSVHCPLGWCTDVCGVDPAHAALGTMGNRSMYPGARTWSSCRTTLAHLLCCTIVYSCHGSVASLRLYSPGISDEKRLACRYAPTRYSGKSGRYFGMYDIVRYYGRCREHLHSSADVHKTWMYLGSTTLVVTT